MNPDSRTIGSWCLPFVASDNVHATVSAAEKKKKNNER